MLTFAPLLCIVVSVVQSAPISRLNIFKSITKFTYHRHGDFPISVGLEEGTSIPEDDKTVNEILEHSLVELTEIIRTLESNDPSKAMRVPVHPVLSQSSLGVFQCLLMMLPMPMESHSSTPWQQYLRESIRKHQCSVMELCQEYPSIFKCDYKGQLEIVILNGRGSFDHLNLLMIPNTVTILSLRSTKLKSISEWTDLNGKSLITLHLDENPDLRLNFDGLRGELSYLPLDHLTVSSRSTAKYFGGDWRRARSQIGEWMKTSTLATLRVGRRIHGSWCKTHFDSDGSWTTDVRQV